MNLKDLAAETIEWSKVPQTVHPGASGLATIRERQLGDIQLRLVIYSPNYVADHWCSKGHIVFVIEGELVIEHQDGTVFSLTSGTSYHVADNEGLPHRVRSHDGATVFIVD
jgi:hypothetical protein